MFFEVCLLLSHPLAANIHFTVVIFLTFLNKKVSYKRILINVLYCILIHLVVNRQAER